ncbi:hypothetical protein EDD85DRAFT_945778 [Armillaria nabsnona]|nr:hypothetical protein EDD85DRAFT_945778 [Armillaria nabsnona]
MSSVIEYHLSITPKPYESAPTPEDISVEEIEARATTEENYMEAMARHAAWKEAKIVAEQENKLRLAHEAQAAKVEALKRKAEEKRKEEERKAEEKLADLKEKKLAEATEKKRKDDLVKQEKKDAVKKLRKEQRKKEKAEKAVESVRLPDVAELLREEKGTNGDSEGELSEASKAQAHQFLKEKCEEKWRPMEPGVSPTEGRKRKQITKSASVVESEEEGVASFSKQVKLEVAGPAEGVTHMPQTSTSHQLQA